MTDPRDWNHEAGELDDLAAVPTEILAAWVTDRGRCLWETTVGDPPEFTGDDAPDRAMAYALCAGCPVRAECLELELELRIGGPESVGVWGGLNELDRSALRRVWSARRRTDLADNESKGGDGA